MRGMYTGENWGWNIGDVLDVLDVLDVWCKGDAYWWNEYNKLMESLNAAT